MKIFSLEGIDGSGKTALVTRLSQELSIATTQRKEFLCESEFINKIGSKLKDVLWNSGDSRDLPDEFWLYLQASWHVLLRNSIYNRFREETSVVVDGWYYKFLSKLLANGWESKDIDLQELYSLVPQPDVTILLCTSPQIAWGRKIYRPTELGLHSPQFSKRKLGQGSFIEYQSRSLDALKSMAKARNWYVIENADDYHIDELLNIVSTIISKELD